jgi:phosphoribosylformylglycinamidine synthase
MAAHSPAMREVIAAAKRGTRVLGVCNGFQILVESGLLPGALLRNRSLKFICKQVWLRTETAQSDFTAALEKGARLRVPVAHGEGNYYAEAGAIKRMEDADLIAFRYCDETGAITEAANPNGSAANIAGIFNEGKTILGMMPHPENTVQEWQANRSGFKLFEGIARSLAA